MATYKEIVERANVALDQAIGRCEAREREILRQKAAALDGIPHAREAVTKHTVALLKASDEFDNARRKAGIDLATAEAQAAAARQQAEDDGLSAWRQADDDALATLRGDVAAADRVYQDALRQGSIGPVNAPERVRIAHEVAVGSANKKYQEAKQADYKIYQQTADATFNAFNRSLQHARTRSDDVIAAAQAVRDAAIDTAETALRAALQNDPVAASVVAAFDAQLASSAADCERDKSAILGEMQNDLAGAAS
ncbi:MAG: hypothetical protein DMF92_23410 [Acidobacteria bacterium]|nr:MAG: hypothetical protein DMF92_23410 [Acidobacteriota bacterium]